MDDSERLIAAAADLIALCGQTPTRQRLVALLHVVTGGTAFRVATMAAVLRARKAANFGLPEQPREQPGTAFEHGGNNPGTIGKERTKRKESNKEKKSKREIYNPSVASQLIPPTDFRSLREEIWGEGGYLVHLAGLNAGGELTLSRAIGETRAVLAAAEKYGDEAVRHALLATIAKGAQTQYLIAVARNYSSRPGASNGASGMHKSTNGKSYLDNFKASRPTAEVVGEADEWDIPPARSTGAAPSAPSLFDSSKTPTTPKR